MAQNSDIASIFESTLKGEGKKLNDVFDKNLHTILQNFDTIDKVKNFSKEDTFSLVMKNGKDPGIPDPHNNIQEYYSTFGNKYGYDYIKEFIAQFTIREYDNKIYKHITHKCVKLTEEYLKDKVDKFVQKYYDKYSPLDIFKASNEASNDIYYVFLHKKNLVHIHFSGANMTVDESDYYTNFYITLKINYTNNMDKLNFASDLRIPKDLRWHHIFDYNIYNLNIAALRSFSFEPEITNRIFKLSQESRIYKTSDISDLITNRIVSPTPSSKSASKSKKASSDTTSAEAAEAAKAAESGRSPTRRSPMSVDDLNNLLSQLTVKQLVSQARSIKLRNYSKLRKNELVRELSRSQSIQSSLKSSDLTGAKTKNKK
jgi:hypothetical protein